MASMSSMVRMASAAVVGKDARPRPRPRRPRAGSRRWLAAEPLLAGAERGRHLHAVAVLGGEGVEDGDLAVVAGDLGVEAQHRRREHGAADVRAPAVGQREVRVHGAVDAGGGQLGLGADHPRARGQQAQQADRVAPHVHGGAAGQGELIADVTLLPQRRREGHVDVGDVARARPSGRSRPGAWSAGGTGSGTPPSRPHLGWRCPTSGHGPGLVGVGREGLLAQDVLARLERRRSSNARAGRWAAGCRRRRCRGPRPVPRSCPGRGECPACGRIRRLARRSRAATAVTTARPVRRAGLTSAGGAMRAAPRMPILSTRRSTGPTGPRRARQATVS